jgi:hypothetical protein
MTGENILSNERRVLVDKPSELLDINPKNWLKPYQKTTVWYMLKMGLFYHFIGLILMYLGSNLVTSVISDYTVPQIPVSVSLALSNSVLSFRKSFGGVRDWNYLVRSSSV